MSGPLLVIDIGNTNVKCGLEQDGNITELSRFSHSQEINEVFDAMEARYRPFSPRAAALASVVPDRTPRWLEECSTRLGISSWELKPAEARVIPVSVPRPETVGADRLANAIAALHRQKSPVIVADFGTALTFDVATPDRGYIGGIIAPGIDLMYSYFSEKTALLPRLTFAPCDQAIGTTTEEAMHAGAFFGYRGMVRECCARVREELGMDVPLLATGGTAADVLADFGEPVEVIPHLTLEGIALAYHHA